MIWLRMSPPNAIIAPAEPIHPTRPQLSLPTTVDHNVIDVPPAPGTVFEMPLRELAMNPFCQVSSIGEIHAIMEGTTE